MDSSLPGSSARGVLQAETLEWVAMPFSRGSSWPKHRSWVSCLAGGFLYHLSHQGSPVRLHHQWSPDGVVSLPPPGWVQGGSWLCQERMYQDAVLRLCRCPPKGSWLQSNDVTPQILLEGNAYGPDALFRASASAVCCSRHRISCRRRLESLILHVCTPFSDVSEIPYVNYISHHSTSAVSILARDYNFTCCFSALIF